LSVEIHCKCGQTLCCKCGNNWHFPIKCEIIEKWKTKCTDDSETINWLNANTKDCPKCHTIIHKDGGCNHMTCNQKKCRHQFCWLCLGPYPHCNCSKYRESQEFKSKEQERSEARKSIERYTFYFSRFEKHSQSIKWEEKLRATINEEMKVLVDRGVTWDEETGKVTTWIGTQFLQEAIDVLLKCRMSLKFTYVFAFYLETSNPKYIFEDNQAHLERETESLSKALSDFSKELTLDQKSRRWRV
jgi:ariadne-1